MVKEQVKDDVQKEVKDVKDPTLPELLQKIKNAPDQEQIDAWKDEHGEIFTSGFSKEEIYVWKSMDRPTYCDLQVTAQENGWNQFQMEEATCDACLLFPSPVDWSKGKAGTPPTLSEQILQNSNFLSPQQAAVLVVKL